MLDPRKILESLRALCRDLDEGRWPRPIELRRLLLPFVLPAAVGLPLACGPVHSSYQPSEDCNNGVDDDGDTLVDCLDPDCREPCAELWRCYAWEEGGLSWCEDGSLIESCAADADGVVQCTLHEAACADGLDNDEDGSIDCVDEDCNHLCGGGTFVYGAPFDCLPDPYPGCSRCDDGEDADGDGLIDCDDPDCDRDSACQD